MYETGLCAIYPAQMHARILVLGFIGSFVLGFLGTAFPRLVGVSGLRLYQLLVLLICLLSSQVLYFLDQIPAADTISLILWTLVDHDRGNSVATAHRYTPHPVLCWWSQVCFPCGLPCS